MFAKNAIATSLLMLMLLVSCGSDNDTGKAGDLADPLGATDTCSRSKSAPGNVDSWSSFKNYVRNCNFRPTSNSFDPTGYYVRSNYIFHFRWYSCNGYNCNTNNFEVWSKTNFSDGEVNSVADARRTNINTKKEAHDSLIALINGSVSSATRISATKFEFVIGDNMYRIDLNLPVEVNPVYKEIVGNVSNKGSGYEYLREESF